MKRGVISENAIKDVCNELHQVYSLGLDAFTVEIVDPFMMVHITYTGIPKVISTNAFLADRVVKCQNCNKVKHFSGFCLKSSCKIVNSKPKKHFWKENKPDENFEWVAFFLD